jgi:hypothetical protein
VATRCDAATCMKDKSSSSYSPYRREVLRGFAMPPSTCSIAAAFRTSYYNTWRGTAAKSKVGRRRAWNHQRRKTQ